MGAISPTRMVLRCALKAAARKAANRTQSDHAHAPPPGDHQQRGRHPQKGEFVQGKPRRARPLEQVPGEAARAVIEQHLQNTKSIGIDARKQRRERAHDADAARVGGALPERFGGIRSQDQPSQEKSAVAIRPDQKERRQQPQPASIFQNRDGRGEQQKGDQVRPVEREPYGHGGGCAGRPQRSIESPTAPPCHQADQSAHRGEQQRAKQHHAAKARDAPDDIEERLRQPLVRQVEVAGDGLAGIRFARAGGSEREGIGHGQRVLLRDVLPGLEMPPEVGVGDFGREQAKQK